MLFPYFFAKYLHVIVCDKTCKKGFLRKKRLFHFVLSSICTIFASQIYKGKSWQLSEYKTWDL